MPGAKWTKEEIALLVREWHDVGCRTMRRKFPHRTWRAISRKAYDLGLPMGIPQGHVSLAEACRILGVSDHFLLTMYSKHSTTGAKPVYPGTSGSPGRVMKTQRRYVDLDEARAVMERYFALESVNGAARRHGIPSVTLLRWVRLAGLCEGETKRGVAIRLPSNVYDDLVAAVRPVMYKQRARMEVLRAFKERRHDSSTAAVPEVCDREGEQD